MQHRPVGLGVMVDTVEIAFDRALTAVLHHDKLVPFAIVEGDRCIRLANVARG